MPRLHPPEFRQRAVELARLREKPVAEIARDLGISDSCLRNWMKQADLDQGRRSDGSAAPSVRSWSSSDASCDLPLAVLGKLANAVGLQPADLLRPRIPPSPVDEPMLDTEPLDRNASRLLRRIHRGEDVRRHLSQVDREITLPQLVNRGRVKVHASGIVLAESVLAPPLQVEHTSTRTTVGD